MREDIRQSVQMQALEVEVKLLRDTVISAARAALEANELLVSAERRIEHQTSEIELMFKSEVLGRLTHFETKLEEQLDQLDERLRCLESVDAS